MTESGRKFIETYKKESKAQAEREAAGTNKETEPEVNIAKIKDDPAENQQKDGGEKDITNEPAGAVKDAAADDASKAAPKWDQLDEMGLPVIDKQKDPETAREVEIVRSLVN